MDKFRNKYRIPSARLQPWDYRWAGAYFITICTANRIHYLGEIENRKMVLSPIGVLADVFWHEIKNHAQNVELGAFVVMPNHVHGILILTGNDNDNDNDNVETLHATSLRHKNEQMAKFPQNRVRFPPSFVPTNPPLPNTPIVWDLNSRGKPVFTTTLFAMMHRFKQSIITSSTIL